MDAVILVKKSDVNKAKKIIKNFEATILNEFKVSENKIKIEFKKTKIPVKEVFKKSFQSKIVNTLLSLPCGIISISQELPDLVETSTNIATIHTRAKSLVIETSQRSSIDSANQYIAKNVAAIFTLAGAKITTSDGYPGWTPDLNSNLLKISKDVFKDLFNKEPKIKAIHAGLECGILEGKNPGMDMLSFGPTIQGAHSPDERVNIETVEKFYRLLKGILKRLSMNN